MDHFDWRGKKVIFKDCRDLLPMDALRIIALEGQVEDLTKKLESHITDAEIMAETPKEFCERMVRTDGKGKCKGMTIFAHTGTCKNCVLFINKICSEKLSLIRANAYLASHPATPQEPPKRRPTPDEMVVGAPVRVRLWDEIVRDGKLSARGHIQFPTIYFNKEMRQYCGTTHKVIKCGGYARLAGCGDWTFIPEMLDYVEPEKVVESKTAAVNFHDWCGKKVVFKDGRNNGASYIVRELTRNISTNEFYFRINQFNGPQYSALLFNLCETQDAASPEPVANTPAPVSPSIIALEGQVDDLTKKLDASKKLCDRLQRRLRAKWEAKRDGEMATREEIIAWSDAGKGVAIINGSASRIRLKNRTDWIPATRGNLKL